MSEEGVSTRLFVFPWFFAFICAKFAGLAGFPAWSWWWLFLPIVPVLTEILKVVFGTS